MHGVVPDIIPFVGGLPVWVARTIAAVVIPALIALNMLVDRWARRRAPWMFGWKPALVMLGLSTACAAVLYARRRGFCGHGPRGRGVRRSQGV